MGNKELIIDQGNNMSEKPTPTMEKLCMAITETYNNIKATIEGKHPVKKFRSNIGKLQGLFADYLMERIKIDPTIAKYKNYIVQGKTNYRIADKETESIVSQATLGEIVSLDSLKNTWREKYHNGEKQTNSKENLPLNQQINRKIINKLEIKKIIDTVQSNKNWDTDYAIRYVVVSISRLVKRDPTFFLLSSDDQKIKLLTEKTYDDYPFVICKTLHELIRDVLYILGIKSEIIIATNTKIPLYALIVEGENKRYFIDALYDLFRSQYHIQPRCYGNYRPSNTNIIDSEALKLTPLKLEFIKEIDSDIGLFEGGYFNDSIDYTIFTDIGKTKSFFRTQDQISYDDYELLKRKIQYISDNLLNKFPVEGPIERNILHRYMIEHLYNKRERSDFKISNRTDLQNYPVVIEITYDLHRLIFQEEIGKDTRYSLKQILETSDYQK